MPISDHLKLASFDVIFLEMMGGIKPIEIMNQYHVDSMSIRDIAKVQGMERWDVERTIKRSREKLCRCGLWPSEWNDRIRKVELVPA